MWKLRPHKARQFGDQPSYPHCWTHLSGKDGVYLNLICGLIGSNPSKMDPLGGVGLAGFESSLTKEELNYLLDAPWGCPETSWFDPEPVWPRFKQKWVKQCSHKWLCSTVLSLTVVEGVGVLPWPLLNVTSNSTTDKSWLTTGICVQ